MSVRGYLGSTLDGGIDDSDHGHGQNDDGGPAFPSHGSMGEVAHEGMTLRDYFAAKAMHAGLVSEAAMLAFDIEHAMNGGASGLRAVAEAAYRLADAMLAARSA